MNPILEEFCDKWVWPTMPGAPGAEFRLRLTRERCVKGWEISLERTLAEIERELATNNEDWKKDRALRGYAAEGVHMSIKQMSGQLLSVNIPDQERYIDLQRMRARQIWDECKHSKLHADVLLGKGWIKDERELMDIAPAIVGQTHLSRNCSRIGCISQTSCHASGGGGTSERPLSASTIEPSAGQYIRQAVHPGYVHLSMSISMRCNGSNAT